MLISERDRKSVNHRSIINSRDDENIDKTESIDNASLNIFLLLFLERIFEAPLFVNNGKKYFPDVT